MKKFSLVRTVAFIIITLLIFSSFASCKNTVPPSPDSTSESSGMQTTEGSQNSEQTSNEETTEPEEKKLTVISDNNGYYSIAYDGINDSSEMYAAYILRDLLKFYTGVALSIDPPGKTYDDTSKVIKIAKNDANSDIGDCGYTISIVGNRIEICADSLAGYDNAINKFTSDLLSHENTVAQIENADDYSVKEIIDSGADYKLDADDYNADYNTAPFYNDKNDSVAYVSNAMWHMFGLIDDGQKLVYRFGNEPTYFEWVSEKIIWSGDKDYIDDAKKKIRQFPQTSTGYMWSWSTYPYWKVDDTYCIHYDGTFRYISAVYDVLSWENSTDFLFEKDTSTSSGDYQAIDDSNGKTVLEKTEAAMNYILEYLNGKEGYIYLTERSVYLNEDGSERFDYVKEANINCWDNTGRPNSAASNYWDNLCFGGYDAYENALFYNALNSMIGIYDMLGQEYTEKADALRSIKEKVKEKYDELYWSGETGRYIACIDYDNNRVDYGLTFLNFEALKYGLGDAEKATSVFSWIDGKRIVEGDTRTGEDIMLYSSVMNKSPIYRTLLKNAKGLVFAPTVNTLAINNKANKKTGIVWWHGPQAINPFTNAAYGLHCENGGYIFYPVFYELMARTKYLGAQSTTDRLSQIAKVYEYNRLNSDAGVWIEGLVGEFPESGLVPTVYIYGLLGINAEADGLHIEPSFNNTYEYMGVTNTVYGGKSYGIEVNRNGALKITCKDNSVKMNLSYTPNHFEKFTLRVLQEDGTVIKETQVAVSDDRNLHLTLDFERAISIELTPITE